MLHGSQTFFVAELFNRIVKKRKRHVLTGFSNETIWLLKW